MTAAAAEAAAKQGRAMLEAITPYPWNVITVNGQLGIANSATKFLITVFHPDDTMQSPGPANAAFIAAAPTLVNDLCGQIEQLAQRYPCDGGCSDGDGPAEHCSQHGRTPAEIWEIATAARAEAEGLRRAQADATKGVDRGSDG